MSRIRLILLLLAAVVACLNTTGFLTAQSDEEENETPLDITPETPEFQEAFVNMRNHLNAMNEVIVRFSNGEDSDDRKWREQWQELVAQGSEIHRALVESALAEYELDPASKPELAEMLFRILRRNCKADRYKGMLPVAQALFENDYPDPRVMGFAAQTAFAMNEYDAARPFFDKLMELGSTSPVLTSIEERLGEYKQLWEEEVRIRQKDAGGEPLPRVLIKTTKGNMEIELFENQAPNTVANFISLAELGFYDGRDFHRVIANFMAQTGCPNEDGTGDPGYNIANEAKLTDARKFFRGSLGLALGANTETGQELPSSGGSQFFITFMPVHDLNGRYTVFGRVIKGIEVLANIQKIDPQNEEQNHEENEPEKIADEIIEIEVLHKRDHEYEPQKL